MHGVNFRRALLLVLLTALAAAFRFWALDRVPPGFHYDEAFEALEAWKVLAQPGYHPIFFPGNFGVEPFFIYLTSVAFGLFGASPLVMRGVAAIIGTLTVPVLYGLGRELVLADGLVPRALPWLAALALATMRWHIMFSRVGIEPVLVPLCLIGMLWAFWWALRRNRGPAWALAGALAGLGPYTYPAGRLLPVVLAATVALVWILDRRRLAHRGRGLLVAACAVVLICAPLAWHFARYPEQLVLRSSQIAVTSAQAPDGNLGKNLLAVLGMFSLRGDSDPRNNLPGLPVLDPWMSVAFYAGLLIAIWRWRRPVFSGVVLAGLVMLLPTILSEYAPHFRRALGAAPSIALLSGLSMAALLEWAGTPPPRLAALMQGGGKPAWRGVAALCVLAVLLASTASTARDYFWRWGNRTDLYYAYDQGLWEIGRYITGLPSESHIYITPRPASDTTLAFALRNGPAARHFDGRDAFVAPAYGPPEAAPATYIVIEHEDDRTAGMLAELYPQARETQQFLDRSGRVYARAFEVPDTGATGRQPEHPVQAAWPEVALLGYDLDQPSYRPGDTISLQLWWQAAGPVSTDWTVFTHLLGPVPNGEPPAAAQTLRAGHDSRPGDGSASMLAWVPGDLVLDEHRIRIPDDAAPGRYVLEAGLYRLADGVRAVTSSPPGQDRVILGQVEVQP